MRSSNDKASHGYQAEEPQQLYGDADNTFSSELSPQVVTADRHTRMQQTENTKGGKVDRKHSEHLKGENINVATVL